jgi:hypothetical protein
MKTTMRLLHSSDGAVPVAVVVAVLLLALLLVLAFYYRPTFEWAWASPWR